METMTEKSHVEEDSPMEKCGFAVHVLVVPLGVLYLTWILASEETLEAWDITYYPPKSWSILIPTALLCLFVAAPILYFALNSMAACSIESIDSLTDDYTRRRQEPTTTAADASSSVPDIYDIDVATINDLVSARFKERQFE
jgi:PIG-P